MDIICTTYPVSIVFIIVATLVLFIFSFTNIFLGLTIILLAYMDCISLMPVIKLVDQLFSVLFKDNIARIKNNIRESFPVKGNKDYKGQAIFLFHPHGVFSLAHAFHVIGNITDWPYKNIRATVHTLMTTMPLVKDFKNHRIVSSNYNTMKETILDGKSLSVALGGLAETKYIESKKLTVVVSTRKGVFKMALETGVPIIPVLTYGENSIHQKMDSRISDIIEYFFKIHVPIPTVESWKAWFKIYKEPLEKKIETHIGEAIEVGEARASVTEAEIVELRNKYIKALKQLYKDTRPADYKDELFVL